MMRKNMTSIMLVIGLFLLAGCSKHKMQLPSDIKGDVYPDADKYSAGDFTYNSADVDAVMIHWHIGAVELVQSDNDTLSVSESGKKLNTDEQMYHYLDGRTLHIQFCHSGSNVHVQSRDKHLQVELPKGIDLSIYNTSATIDAEMLELKSVMIASQSGSLDCESIVADHIDLSTSSGTIETDRIMGNSGMLTTSSGKVEVDNIDISGSLLCTSISGKVTLEDIEAEKLTVSTASGNVNLETVIHCPNMDITTVSGKVSMVLPKSGGRVRFVTASGSLKTGLLYETIDDLHVFGEGKSEIDVETTSGNLEIE